MKKGKYILRVVLLLVALWTTDIVAYAQSLDSLQASRLLMRCVQYGVGYSNLYDTYLSTQEYKGLDFRVARETMRLTNIYDGNVSLQNIFQANLAYTHNPVDNNNTIAGLVNWNYGLHYQFRLSDNFKLLAGCMSDVNFGFVYNLHNTNNPASARAYINLDASGLAIWHFKFRNLPLTLRYQLNIPFFGVMFSPEMGQSYYEIFTLGNWDGVIKITSLHNQPSLRQWLSLDIPLGSKAIRLSYLADLQQSRINGIKTHTYSHVFMLGFVKRLYSLHSKDGRKLPPSLQVY